MTSSRRNVTRAVWFLRGVYVLFFFSGALGLVYEVLWLRKLLLVFGSTVHAASTVLTVFFGGLALGSWLFGRLIDRREVAGLTWYAACEAGIGLYAFLTVPLFHAIEPVYIFLYRASGFSHAVLVGGSFLCSSLLLLVPTMLMGATFPIVSRFMIRTTEELGVTVASLYGMNTIGAMAGTVFVYHVALQKLGWLTTLQCAGLANLILAVTARVLDRNLQVAGFRPAAGRTPAAKAVLDEESPASLRVLLIAFGGSGFSAMLYEVAWMRSLTLVLGSSIYAFCIMLATFLGGIALGSLSARLLLRRRRASLEQFTMLEVALAAYGLCSISLFGWLPEGFVRLWPLVGESFSGLSRLQVFLSMCVMVLPTFLMGLLFPVVGELVTGRVSKVGSRLGQAYAVNTLGGILGSFLCGFWLIPSFGIAWALVIGALVNLSAALLLYLCFSDTPVLRRVGLAAGAFAVYLGVGGWVVVPSWQRQVLAAGVYLDPNAYEHASVHEAVRQSELLFYRESLNTTVSVHRNRVTHQLYLKVGGKTDASSGIDMGTQVLAAHIPLLLHPQASRVLVIGLGSGVTVGSVARYPVSAIDCAEIDPAVVDGARLFAEYNHHVHDDPRVTIHIADGRNFLLASEARYDVIISEPSNPWMEGVAKLFTKEFYELCRRRLAADGVMCQWVQLYRIFPSDVKLVLKTFQEVFPYTTVWSTIPGDIAIVGSAKPLELDYEHLKQALAVPGIREDLERISLANPRAFLEFFWLGPEQVKRLVGDVAWRHEDDQPWLEFSTPKAVYLGALHRINYRGLEQLKAPVWAIAPHVTDRDQDAAFYLMLGGAYRFRNELEPATKAFARALELEPHNATAAMRLGEAYAKRGMLLDAHEALTRAIELDPKLVEAYYFLARLRWRQGDVDGALKAYGQAASLKAPDAELAEETGLAFKRAKRWWDAARYLQLALSQQPQRSRPDLALALAESLNALRRFDEAAGVLTAAMARERQDARLVLLLAQLRVAQGNRDEAKRLFKQVVSVAPTMPEAYFGLGELAFQQGALRQASRWFVAGLRYDPYNAKALEMLQTIQQKAMKSHG